MSAIIRAADAVVTALNGQAFSQSFYATRGYLPIFDLAELQTLRVTVIPKADEIEMITRGRMAHELQIDVGVQKFVGAAIAGATATLDALMSFVQELLDYLQKRDLTDAEARLVSWASIANAPVYDPKHLQEQGVFTSLITVSYTVWL